MLKSGRASYSNERIVSAQPDRGRRAQQRPCRARGAAAARNVGANDLDVALRLIQDQVGELCRRTLAGGRISGSYLLIDFACQSGTKYAVFWTVDPQVPRLADVATCTRYSELYRDGGRTLLPAEDLYCRQPDARSPNNLDLGRELRCHCEWAEILRVNQAIPVNVLRGNLVERLHGAFTILTELSPDVLVHLGHPNDPIAVAIMQPGIAQRHRDDPSRRFQLRIGSLARGSSARNTWAPLSRFHSPRIGL